MLKRQRHWVYAICGAIIVALFCGEDYRPTDIDAATARYRFSVAGWEAQNLPDKWLRRIANSPAALVKNQTDAQRLEQVNEYFALGERLRFIGYRLIDLETRAPPAPAPLPAETARAAAALRQEQAQLRDRQARLRPGVEETLESAVADTLQSLGFRAWTGVFPPVDTVLTGSPTVLITSPRARIARGDDVVLQTGLTAEERGGIERQVESRTGLSALVVNTGGIAFYPSIALPDAGLDFALEIIAHEWVHHWLWFRPLGRRYFAGGDLTTLNETVATIAGREIGQLARQRLTGDAPPPPALESPARPARDPERFDFQAEMRAARLRVDALLAAGDVAGAEAYMEERRRVFVGHGYYIRRLNQAYFAFHGTYATTGAAGVSVIGEQVAELRRRSPSLRAFIRTAAGITDAGELAGYLDDTAR